MSNDVYLLDAVYTPIGRSGGGLAGVRPDDLAAHVVGEVVRRRPDLDPARDSRVAGLADAPARRRAGTRRGLHRSRPGLAAALEA